MSHHHERHVVGVSGVGARLPGMDLPVMPPVRPMLAKSVKGIPDPATYSAGDVPGLSFEPKWDGFRCLVFKDGDEVELASPQHQAADALLPRGGRGRAGAAARALRARRRDLRRGRRPAGVRGAAEAHPPGGLADHPAGREDPRVVRRLRPARARRRVYVDRPSPSGGRPWRRRWRGSRARATSPAPPPTARSAEQWFDQFEGAGLDGVIAKPLGAPYLPNARTMLKIKHERTADVVLVGYREHKTSTPEKPLLGSLLLGLYADGRLQHIGVSALVHRRPPRRADRRAAAAGLRPRGAPVGGLGGVGDRQPRPDAGHPEPVEPGQGPQLHAAAPRAGAGGGLRPHGGASLPPHRAVPALAPRPRS